MLYRPFVVVLLLAEHSYRLQYGAVESDSEIRSGTRTGNFKLEVMHQIPHDACRGVDLFFLGTEIYLRSVRKTPTVESFVAFFCCVRSLKESDDSVLPPKYAVVHVDWCTAHASSYPSTTWCTESARRECDRQIRWCQTATHTSNHLSAGSDGSR